MRTSVLVASFALLAIALLAPASSTCVGSVEEKASARSKFSTSTADAAKCAESVAVNDGVNSYEKSTTDEKATTSASSGAAENNSYKYKDASGKSVLAKSSKKVLAASTSSNSASTSVEKSVKAAPPCGCSK